MIDNAVIEELLSAAKIKTVVESYIPLKKKGINWVGLCPFHEEKSGSFTVSEAKGIYKCFGCGRSGNAISFLMERGDTFLDSVNSLAKTFGVEIPDSKPKEYFKPQEVKTGLTEKAEKYLTQTRGISKNTLLRFEICSKKEFMPQISKETDCILFKYYRKKNLVNIKYRDGAKNFKLEKGAELIFYNLDAIEKTKECIIVEGEIDCLTAYDCGIHNVVSVPNGASKGSQRLEYLDNCVEYFIDKEKVIIATDNDQAGKTLRDELTRRFGVDRCWHVNYPSGCKDFNDVKTKLGAEKVVECIKNAEQPPLAGVLTVADIEKELDTLFVEGYPSIDGIDWVYFDELIKFSFGRLTIITGIPNSGKSDFIDQISVRLANRRGWKFGVFSPERLPSEIHVSKLASVYIGMPFVDYPDRKKMSTDQYVQAKYFCNEHYYFLNVEEVDCTIDGILSKAEEMVLRFGINGLIIDPYNYIESKRPNGMSETEYVSLVLGKIKMFSYKYKVHPFLVAHPTKMKKNANGKYDIATLYDISGSANFFNKTDNGISLYRNYDTGLLDVYVQKVKYFWEGKVGYTSFKYDPYTSRYSTEMGDFEQEYKYAPYFAQPTVKQLEIEEKEPF